MRALVVEDEILLQMLLVDCLEDAGFEVEAAGSAAGAIAKLGAVEGSVDAAIIDVGLPDRRGDSLVEELRATYPKLPIVVATGYDGDDLRLRFGGQSNIVVIGKPYDPQNLVTALQAMGISV